MGITHFMDFACKKPGATLALKLAASLMIISASTIASEVFF
jgi:hypothetical protein